MKYKVGDEVLVKARIIEVKEEENVQYKIKRCGNPVPYNFASGIYVGESDIVPQTQMTAEEAWKIAKKILLYPSQGGYNATELEEIFGRTEHLWELTPQEAKAKIEAWEAEKEIKVGDVVNVCGDIAVVTSFGTDGDSIHVIYSDGIVNSYRKDKDIKKTGSHIDIDWFLKQIGGDE